MNIFILKRFVVYQSVCLIINYAVNTPSLFKEGFFFSAKLINVLLKILFNKTVNYCNNPLIINNLK